MSLHALWQAVTSRLVKMNNVAGLGKNRIKGIRRVARLVYNYTGWTSCIYLKAPVRLLGKFHQKSPRCSSGGPDYSQYLSPVVE